MKSPLTVTFEFQLSKKNHAAIAIDQLKSRAACIQRECSTGFKYQWLLRRNKDGKYLLTDWQKKAPKLTGWTLIGKFDQSEKVTP